MDQAELDRDIRRWYAEHDEGSRLELVPPSTEVTAAAALLAGQAQGHPWSADLSSHLLAIGRKPAAGRVAAPGPVLNAQYGRRRVGYRQSGF